MIDTIKYRLHNSDRYPTLCKRIDREISEKKIRYINYEYIEGGKLLIARNLGGKNRLGCYNLNFTHSLTYNFIDIEISIPKYLYGSNVIEFLPSKYNSYQGFLKMTKTLYKMLVKFTFKFFETEFLLQVDTNDIEICRIDFCYNEVYNNNAELKASFNTMKRVFSNSVKNKKNIRYYETSCFYKTDRYSIKIYQKQPDFEKTDLEKLRKLTADKLFIHNLQEWSSRILRYEVTLRKRIISDIIKSIPTNDKPQYITPRELKELENKTIRFGFTENPYNIQNALQNNICSLTLKHFRHLLFYALKKVKKMFVNTTTEQVALIKLQANNNIKNKASLTTFITLSKNHSFEELISNGYFSRSTAFRLRKTAEKLLNTTSIQNETPVPHPKFLQKNFQYLVFLKNSSKIAFIKHKITT